MKLPLIFPAAALVFATPLMAQSLIDAALADGSVGERFDGYLGIVGSPSDALRRQVNGINITRRSLYTGLAAKKGVTPEEVALTAACTTLARVAAGQVYFSREHGWQRRTPGQPAPVPTYCGS
nr:YdbL family protein [uncultured Sphingomonas sp.]